MGRATAPATLEEIGPRLARTREALGIKQDECAAVAGVTVPAWSDWERSRRTPAVASMLKFRARYGVSLDWIYAGDPSRLPFELAEALGLTRNNGGSG
jgi:transcriptional regulator with XRE-family HTH domain